MTRRPIRFLTIAAATFSLVGSLAAGRFDDLRDREFMAQARAGFNAIYSLDYANARSRLQQLQKEYPQHPVPPLHLAIVVWLEELFQREELDLDRFVAPGYFTKESGSAMSEEKRRAFFEGIEKAQSLCRAILEENPQHKDARYFLGASYGILGSFAMTIDRSTKQAFSHGRKAYKLHRELVDEDPNYYDAYMTVGMYEYIVGNLPWYIKWLAAIAGYRGNEKQGFEYLDLATRKGQYVQDDARTLQMILYIREERAEDALANARALHEKYPRNFLLHINQAQILESLGRPEAAASTLLEVVRRAESGVENYQKLPLTRFRLNVAAKLLELGDSTTALTQFQGVLRDEEAHFTYQVRSHLHSAEILLEQGKDGQAASHFEALLELPAYDRSHKKAKRGLKEIRKRHAEQARGNREAG